MADKLKITLVKSPIGAIPKQRATVEALGLKKVNKTVEMPDNDAVRGMIWHVRHLVKVDADPPAAPCRHCPRQRGRHVRHLVKVEEI